MPIRKPSADSVNISSEGKREAVIQRLTKEIVGRIINKDPRLQKDRQIVEQVKTNIGKNQDVGEGQEREFVYHVINGDATKTLNTLNMDDSSYLIKRLEHYARESVEKNLE